MARDPRLPLWAAIPLLLHPSPAPGLRLLEEMASLHHPWRRLVDGDLSALPELLEWDFLGYVRELLIVEALPALHRARQVGSQPGRRGAGLNAWATRLAKAAPTRADTRGAKMGVR